MNMLIPQADTIPVAWGWFQFLSLLTFPLHLLAMNAMLGCITFGLFLHVRGGAVELRLAHRLAVSLPLIIAFVVNLGVAPLLFLQVLYGQFIYTSSILMGIAWIMLIPILLIAYYGAYLYDFRFLQLGERGPKLAGLICFFFFVIAWLFTENMQLMSLPGKFGEYFQHMNGSYLLSDYGPTMPRYLHTVCGALAIGGLCVALLGKFQANKDREMAWLAEAIGLRTFMVFTFNSVGVGIWYLLSLPREQMLIFMGRDPGATVAFALALILTLGALISAARNKLWVTIGHGLAIVFVMALMRSWLRSAYLREFFTLDRLQVVSEYSPMIFFFLTLLFGIGCLVWLYRTTRAALNGTQTV